MPRPRLAKPHPQQGVDASQLQVGQRIKFAYKDQSSVAGVRGLIVAMTTEGAVVTSDKSGKDVLVRFDNIAQAEVLPEGSRVPKSVTDTNNVLAALVPERGRAWSWLHALAWVIVVFGSSLAIGRSVLESTYESTGNLYSAATQASGAARLMLILALGLVVWRKADSGKTRALGITALSILSLLPLLTWGAWAAIPVLLTAEGLDWPMKRRNHVPATLAVREEHVSPVEHTPDATPTGAPLPQRDTLATIQGLAHLRDQGAITSEEYAAKKAQLLARI
jgi:hypothetical protein